MDQKKIDDAIDTLRDETTGGLVALSKKGPQGHDEEYLEAIRRMLFVRGVSDPATHVASHEGEMRGGLPAPGFGAIGGLIGGFVGYLIGTSPSLSFFDVITRGASLNGLNALLRPAAEYAFNFTLAGAVLGAAGGVAVAHLGTAEKQSRPSAVAAAICSHCGASHRPGTQFCGQCGKPLVSTCPKCGKAAPLNQRFCDGCGAGIGSAS
jgi:hypothetical protein